MSTLMDMGKIALMFANRGGRVERGLGGVSMGMPGGMGYVPEQSAAPVHELMQADTPTAKGGSGIEQALGIASKFMGKNAGGRAGYADGGRYDNDDPIGLKAGLGHVWDFAKDVGRGAIQDIKDESARADWTRSSASSSATTSAASIVA